MRLWWVLQCQLREPRSKAEARFFRHTASQGSKPGAACLSSRNIIACGSSHFLRKAATHRATPHPDGSPFWHLQLMGRVGFCSMTQDTDVLCRAPLAKFTGADGERPARVLAHPHRFSVICVGPCLPSLPPRTEHLYRLTTQSVMIQHHFHKPELLIEYPQ